MLHIDAKKVYVLIIVALALVARLMLTTYIYAFQNVPISNISFTPAYRLMTLSWDTY